MKVTPTAIADVLILEPRVFGDERGFFMESFNQKTFNETTGLALDFVQDNHSRSAKGVLRGLHYQLPPHAQGKLVRVTQGTVFDSAIIGTGTANRAPSGSIATPTSDVTINEGESVTFAGTASDPDGDTPLTYRWTFDGGAPVATVEDPGAVRFNAIGNYLVEFTVTDRRGLSDPTPGRLTVFVDYLTIGFEHILSGADHLLFVFGLFLLCSGIAPLAKTVTAFTVGHSITLSLAALGYARFPSGPIEVLIAATVLALAVDLARDEARPTWMRRFPWPMALVFGLLHGLGFAGALREVGLPDGEIPMALFSFNVGIEIGQLTFVAALLALTPLVRRIPIPLPRRVAVYAMGSLAAFWMIERGAALL